MDANRICKYVDEHGVVDDIDVFKHCGKPSLMQQLAALSDGSYYCFVLEDRIVYLVSPRLSGKHALVSDIDEHIDFVDIIKNMISGWK